MVGAVCKEELSAIFGGFKDRKSPEGSCICRLWWCLVVGS